MVAFLPLFWLPGNSEPGEQAAAHSHTGPYPPPVTLILLSKSFLLPHYGAYL